MHEATNHQLANMCITVRVSHDTCSRFTLAFFPSLCRIFFEDQEFYVYHGETRRHYRDLQTSLATRAREERNLRQRLESACKPTPNENKQQERKEQAADVCGSLKQPKVSVQSHPADSKRDSTAKAGKPALPDAKPIEKNKEQAAAVCSGRVPPAAPGDIKPDTKSGRKASKASGSNNSKNMMKKDKRSSKGQAPSSSKAQATVATGSASSASSRSSRTAQRSATKKAKSNAKEQRRPKRDNSQGKLEDADEPAVNGRRLAVARSQSMSAVH